MQLFYCETFSDNKAFLSQDESRHLKVLRKSTGDEIKVIDGKGSLFTCRLLNPNQSAFELEIIRKETIANQRSYYFHLVIAPTKQNERIEWMLEKAIEVGLDEISFIETEHSEKSRLNFKRLEKIAISALKQSNQFSLPKINTLVKLKDFKSELPMYLAFCSEHPEKLKLKDVFGQSLEKRKINILIGPEGDFSNSEIEMLLKNGAIPLDLGQTRLRTETAGLYCAMVLNALG